MFERNSDIEVDVLDFAQFFPYVRELLVEHKRISADDATIVRISTARHGLVHTTQGLFALNCWGVGPAKPITAENPLELGFHMSYPIGSGRSSPVGPRCHIEFDETDLLELPMLERTNLGLFIQGGRSPQMNFFQWREFLEPIAIKRRVHPMSFEKAGA